MRNRIMFIASTIAVLCSSYALAVPITVDDFYTPDSTVYSVAASSGLLANDSSTEKGLRVVSFSAPTQGSLNLATDGSLTFTPDSGQSTNTVVTYTATDDSNATSSASVTFDLVSTLPTAVDDFYTPTSTVLSVTAPSGWLANDTGGIGSLHAVSFSAPSQGVVNAATDGSFTYTPASGQTTNETITYTMRDDLNRLSSANVTFDLVSTLPTAVDDFYTPTSTVLSVAAPSGWLANDTGGIGSLHAVSFSVPSQGAVNAATDGSFTYTPAFGQTTNETITYTMRDDLNRLSSANVTFDLVSTLPTAVDDFYSVASGSNLFVDALLGLLDNDLYGIGTLSVTTFIQSTDGLLNLASDGSFLFKPNAGFMGLTTFDYFISDSLGRSSSAKVTIDVLGAYSVPEPSTIWMLLAGLGLVDTVRRRRLN